MTITQSPAHKNNFGIGRGGKTPKKVIVHWIVGSLASADATFKNPARLASAHYGIEDNKIHQYVKETDTAWHASNLTINRESIGIEHSGGELLPGSTTQRRKPSDLTHETSGKLIAEICKRYSIPIDKEHILPHNKFSNTQCPGTLDVDKLITIAKAQSVPMPSTPIISNQTKIPQILNNQGEPMEVQAIVSMIKDQKRTIEDLTKKLAEATKPTVTYIEIPTTEAATTPPTIINTTEVTGDITKLGPFARFGDSIDKSLGLVPSGHDGKTS